MELTMRLGEPKSSLSRLRQLKEEVLAKKKKIEEEVAMVGVAEKL